MALKRRKLVSSLEKQVAHVYIGERILAATITIEYDMAIIDDAVSIDEALESATTFIAAAIAENMNTAKQH